MPWAEHSRRDSESVGEKEGREEEGRGMEVEEGDGREGGRELELKNFILQ